MTRHHDLLARMLGQQLLKTRHHASLDLREARERVERLYIQRALAVYDNNVSRAAEALGISRPSLYALVKKLGMTELGNT